MNLIVAVNLLILESLSFFFFSPLRIVQTSSSDFKVTNKLLMLFNSFIKVMLNFERKWT